MLAAIFLFAYPFLIYPVALALWTRIRSPRPPEHFPSVEELPTVALVICALNEQQVIRKKIENSLALNYPKDKLTIIVISDGSTDHTAQIAKEYEHRGVVVMDRPLRRGKIANLNEVLPSRTEELLALSDANVFYDADALRQMAYRFRDRSVGCVSGKVVLTDTTPELHGPTEQYYSVEWGLQEKASQVYSMVGADGAMYALRQGLFQTCPGDTLIDDLVIPMHVIRCGKRVVFEARAIGWEQGVTSLAEEFRRKVRIAAGAAQGLIRGNIWPAGAPMRFWFIFVSHKLLRWLSPITGGLVIAQAAMRMSEPASQAVVAGIAAMVTLALVRLITGWKHTLFSAPFYFLFGQVTLAIGLLKGLTGRQTVLWAKADR